MLDRPCAECGMDTRELSAAEIPAMLRSSVATWQQELGRQDVRQRPEPQLWSPLEYACHVRDVCVVFDGRLRRMLTEDDPTFDNWNQDATAIDNRYGEQDPEVVAAELGRAADVLADRFAQVSGEQWQRTGSRSDGAVFTVQAFGRYFIHDVVHHLHDVGHG